MLKGTSPLKSSKYNAKIFELDAEPDFQKFGEHGGLLWLKTLSGFITYVQIVGKITEEGVFLEQLETNPGKYLPEVEAKDLGDEVVQVSRLIVIVGLMVVELE